MTRKNTTVPFFLLFKKYHFLDIFISPASRTTARGTRRRRRTRAGTGWGRTPTTAESAAIKNSLDIHAITFGTGYLAFFHFFDSYPSLKSLMAVLTFKIIIWHTNFPFFSYYFCQLYFLYLFIL